MREERAERRADRALLAAQERREGRVGPRERGRPAERDPRVALRGDSELDRRRQDAHLVRQARRPQGQHLAGDRRARRPLDPPALVERLSDAEGRELRRDPAPAARGGPRIGELRPAQGEEQIAPRLELRLARVCEPGERLGPQILRGPEDLARLALRDRRGRRQPTGALEALFHVGEPASLRGEERGREALERAGDRAPAARVRLGEHPREEGERRVVIGVVRHPPRERLAEARLGAHLAHRRVRGAEGRGGERELLALQEAALARLLEELAGPRPAEPRVASQHGQARIGVVIAPGARDPLARVVLVEALERVDQGVSRGGHRARR